MNHSPPLFAGCVVLNNRGVRKFVKEQNLEEACLLFRRALCIVKKQWTDLLEFNQISGCAKASSQYKVESKRPEGHLAQVTTTESENVETTQQDTRQSMGERNLVQVSGQQHHLEAAQGSQNGKQGPPLRKRWNSISQASPVRLGTNYTARYPDPLHWRLATTVVAFNLALTYHLLGCAIPSPLEAPKRWKAAFGLFELACSLRIAVVSKKSFKGDMLTALDALIVQSTLSLHVQLNSTPSESSSVRKLERYVQQVQSSLHNKR